MRGLNPSFIAKISKRTEEICEEISKLLEECFERLRGRDLMISFSGGLDSSILAFLAGRISDPLLCSVGVEGSVDLLNARDSRLEIEKILGKEMRHVEIGLNKEIVLEALKDMRSIGISDPLMASFEIPLYVAMRECEPETVVSGQGADELFLGYAKYLKDPSGWKEDLKKLLHVVVPFEDKMAKKFGKEIVRPYLDRRIIKLASAIPLSERICEGVRKAPLRLVAKKLGLPERIVLIEKKAAQYGSGASKLMREIAKELGVDFSRILEVI